MKKIITMFTVLVLFSFAIVTISQTSTEKTYAEEKQVHTQKVTGEKQVVSDQEEISHKKIVALTDKFMELLVQDIDDQYKVINYQTKEELIKAFEPYVTKEAVQPYIDYYYEEEKNGLYIVPTETPPWFDKSNDYDKQMKDNQVIVTQQNENALYGEYTISITFEKINDQWKIVNISNQ
ncbi:hypothetical protein MUN88_18875 [Gracilibacillus caseinilyticus]|uniref:DUF3993 domain-containing protein n=1 Tax=Gracilibacillus caseinilyticus TaxID=2932256 RepID=A0ABY4EW60_9BACI|nr:hypothetical protein [Gracilibacillus caseinilyticus]UOQ48092.1 hypothetical protein MUN88_18875 [Gracilibacillus caseinilyticus]